MKATATAAYQDQVERARQNLSRIAAGLGAHIARTSTTPAGTYSARNTDWGDVGDIERLNELLEEAARFINSEGE